MRKSRKQTFNIKVAPDKDETAEDIFKMSVIEKKLDEMMGALTDEEREAVCLCVEHLLSISGVKRISIEQKFRKGEVVELKVSAIIFGEA